ncbi:sensor domain-containing protein [Thermoactinospora rubra]|uniref:sensor domain-containing protein n=1 Tax=Thermoactinospora rubra TaxID=1088767 RepID=UPI00118166DB|nr:sensor domain-containing protein [Thermoactinospora rubra]
MKIFLFVTLAASLTGGIPQGFLLYEKAAATKDDNPETSWSVSAKTGARLVVNPCDTGRLAQRGRTAAKTVVYTAVPDFSKAEQVVLYGSAAAARDALAALRADLRRCAVQKDSGSHTYRYSGRRLPLGDEALAVTGQAYWGKKPGVGGERAVVARKGNALVLYTQGGEWGKPSQRDFARQTRDARTMLAKICDIAACG